MIIDKETNTVYFSDIIRTCKKFEPTFQRLKFLLDKHQIQYEFLKDTKDIWCRDYMPIQIEKDEFIQFKYEPSYLEEDLDLQSDPKEVLQSNRLKAKFSNINLDGGNVVKWSNQAILTERIFEENTLDKELLITQLKKELKATVHFIPAIDDDMTGHSDGHLRFINKNQILVNNLRDEAPNWTKGFFKMVNEAKFNFTEMPWFETNDKDSAIGIYVNYLEIENVILFPIFEVDGNKDKEALKVIRKVFPNRMIEPININEIAKEGGLLNCITWTIKA